MSVSHIKHTYIHTHAVVVCFHHCRRFSCSIKICCFRCSLSNMEAVTDFWPNRLWPSLFDRLWPNRLWPSLFDRLWPNRLWPILVFISCFSKRQNNENTWKNQTPFWAPKGGTPKGGTPKGGGARTQKKWGPEGWGPEGWGPEGWGGPNLEKVGPRTVGPPKGGAPKGGGART